MDTKVPQRTLRKTVIDHVEPEFVVFFVVLCDLASHIFSPESNFVSRNRFFVADYFYSMFSNLF